MNFLLKIVIFSMCINFASGIMMLVTDVHGNKIFTTGNLSMTNYSHTPEQFTGMLNGTVSPTSEIRSGNNFIFNILDYFGLGFLVKLADAIHDFMFGFVTILEDIAVMLQMDSAMRFLIFGGLKAILIVIYTISFIQLFLPGRNISNNN